MLISILVIGIIVALVAAVWFFAQLKNATSQNENISNEMLSK